MATPIVLSKKDILRFWSKVHRTDGDGCWEWIGGKFPAGYGNLYLSSLGSGTPAHRIAWVIEHGPIPNGMCVRHVCDNPSCIRHLELGTVEENNRDRARRGRNGKRGVQNWPNSTGKGRPPRVPPEERFWAKVQKTDSCWEWTGALAGGYGRFAISDSHLVPAHHFSYWLCYAEQVPPGLILRHLCNNRRCVRVSHLTAGTQKENVHDTIRAGHFAPSPPLAGAQHPCRKLGPLDVIYIRDALGNNHHSINALAAMFSVARNTITSAARGKTWRSVGAPIVTEIEREPTKHRAPYRQRTPPAPEAVETRFWQKVRKTAECWFWISANGHGHGSFWDPHLRRHVRADRFAYELTTATLPSTNILIHTCRRTDCCNPDHMRPTSKAEAMHCDHQPLSL